MIDVFTLPNHGLPPRQSLRNLIVAAEPDEKTVDAWKFVREAAMVGALASEDINFEIFCIGGAADLFVKAITDDLDCMGQHWHLFDTNAASARIRRRTASINTLRPRLAEVQCMMSAERCRAVQQLVRETWLVKAETRDILYMQPQKP